MDGLEIADSLDGEHLLFVNEALDRLAAEDSVKADIVKLRFFIGLDNREIAELLGISERTVERAWRFRQDLAAGRTQRWQVTRRTPSRKKSRSSHDGSRTKTPLLQAEMMKHNDSPSGMATRGRDFQRRAVTRRSDQTQRLPGLDLRWRCGASRPDREATRLG